MLDLGVGPGVEVGVPVEIAPGVRRLTAPNPGLMTGPGTNTYLVGTHDVAVVDPGPDHAEHRAAGGEAAGAGGGSVRWVLVTHTHGDHAPGAAPLACTTGAEVIGFDQRDGFHPDRSVGDGWTLRSGDVALRAVHTPGHASNHLCWLVEPIALLLSGDHVMHGSTVVIRPPDGDMAEYLRSLRRLVTLHPRLAAIAPGHGRIIGDPVASVEGIVAHRLEREALVLGALRSLGGATIDELVRLVYADVDDEHRKVGRASLWAHLRKLEADGAVRRLDRPGPTDAGPTDAGPTDAEPDDPELASWWVAVDPET
jgi:glyoxylase-like metal-dependent hydrolase (beta-lactamase superfamily II)